MNQSACPETQPNARVLVVDDERVVRWSIRQRLEEGGCEVLTVESGEECLEVLSRFRPDVLFLDVCLPGIDGIEVLGRARQELPDLAVVMISGHSTVDVVVRAMKLGATDFVTKPFDLAAIEVTLRRTLENMRLRREVAVLTAELEDARGAPQLVGASPAMHNLRDMVAKVARSDASTVLIGGESGSGKGVVARAIHASSRRAQKPFMTINCTSLPEALAESELLGHERGAFTDAKNLKKGLFELADGGTAFLDEIGDMALGTQAKLLRLLEEKTFKRVGGTADMRVDVRIIAATHRDLRAAVNTERFRQDLYFRLNIVSIHVPALRDHIVDLPTLCAQFVATFNHELRRKVEQVTPEALEVMSRYHWPGNVRELRNVIERAFILEATGTIGVENLPPEIRGAHDTASAPAHSGATAHLVDQEIKMIRGALEQTSGNQSRAARQLGITRDTLRYRMKKFGLL